MTKPEGAAVGSERLEGFSLTEIASSAARGAFEELRRALKERGVEINPPAIIGTAYFAAWTLFYGLMTNEALKATTPAEGNFFDGLRRLVLLAKAAPTWDSAQRATLPYVTGAVTFLTLICASHVLSVKEKEGPTPPEERALPEE